MVFFIVFIALAIFVCLYVAYKYASKTEEKKQPNDQQIDQTSNQNSNQTIDQNSNQTIDQNSNQNNNQTNNQTIDQTIDQTINQNTNQTTDQTSNQTTDIITNTPNLQNLITDLINAPNTGPITTPVEPAPIIPKLPSRIYQSIDKWEFPSGDISTYTGSNADCPDVCDQTPGCVAFSINMSGPQGCQLKSKLAPPGLSNSQITTYYVGRNYSHIPKWDYPNNNLKYHVGPYETCNIACDNTPGCVGYARHLDNGANCWLKSDLYGTGNPSTIRDIYYNGRPYTVKQGWDHPDNDIKYHSGSFESCAVACDQTPKCVGYTADLHAGSNCWLKSYMGTAGGATPYRNSYYAQV
jgi:hypothetical protein